MSAKVLAGILGTEGKMGRDFVPLIPDLPVIDPQVEQQKAIAGNIAALPGVEQFASGLNKFSIDELQKMLKASIPGYSELMTQESQNLMSGLKGELPKGVQDTLKRSSAAHAFSGGYGGSPASSFGEAETLGLGSLQYIRDTMTATDRWIQDAASRLPHQADMSGAFLTYAQQSEADTRERNNIFNYKLMKAKYAASPNAMDNAITGLTDWAENIMASAATMGISGGMGGGTGGLGSMMGGGAGGGSGSGGGGGTSPDPYGLGTGWYPGGGNGFANSVSGG